VDEHQRLGAAEHPVGERHASEPVDTPEAVAARESVDPQISGASRHVLSALIEEPDAAVDVKKWMLAGGRAHRQFRIVCANFAFTSLH